MENYYKILQVDPAACPEVIAAAYKRLAQKFHPDVSKNSAANEQMRLLNEAREILMDASQRAAYDRDLGAQSAGSFPFENVRFNTTMSDLREAMRANRAQEQGHIVGLFGTERNECANHQIVSA
jgi:DnaJ-class molecular chaperone